MRRQNVAKSKWMFNQEPSQTYVF